MKKIFGLQRHKLLMGDRHESDIDVVGPYLCVSPSGQQCSVTAPLRSADRYRGTSMRKLIVLVEAFALAAGIVTIATINPQTGQMMVAASRAANGPQESAMGKIIAFARAAGTVAVLTVHPQLAKPCCADGTAG